MRNGLVLFALLSIALSVSSVHVERTLHDKGVSIKSPAKPKLQVQKVLTKKPEAKPLLGAKPPVRPLLGSKPPVKPILGARPPVRPLLGSKPPVKPILLGGRPPVKPILGGRPPKKLQLGSKPKVITHAKLVVHQNPKVLSAQEAESRGFIPKHALEKPKKNSDLLNKLDSFSKKITSKLDNLEARMSKLEKEENLFSDSSFDHFLF